MKLMAMVITMAAVGCTLPSRNARENPVGRGIAYEGAAPGSMAAPAPDAGFIHDGSESVRVVRPTAAPAVERPVNRKLIFNGTLALQVTDAEAVERQMRRIVEEVKGWIHRAEGTSLTLRVPATEFSATMERLAALGRVLGRSVVGTDVTDEFRDLEIRIHNAEQIRARLAALLEKAKDVKEALEVERELGRITEEIERLKGQIQRMTDHIAHSTIVVMLHRAAPMMMAAEPAVRFPFPWIRELGAEQLTNFRN